MATTGIPIDMEAGSGDVGGALNLRAGEGLNGDGGSASFDAGPSRGGQKGTCTIGATARQTTIGGDAITVGSTGVPVLMPGGVQLGGSSGPQALQGAGSPEGVVTAAAGSTYQRTDGSTGTSFYVKESGSENTGWAAYGAVATPSALRRTANTTQSIAATGSYIQITSLGTSVETHADYTWESNGATINRTGRYMAILGVNFPGTTGNWRGLRIDHLDSTEVTLRERHNTQQRDVVSANWFGNLTGFFTVETVGDRLLVYIAHDSAAGAQNLNSGAATFFKIVRLGGL